MQTIIDAISRYNAGNSCLRLDDRVVSERIKDLIEAQKLQEYCNELDEFFNSLIATFSTHSHHLFPRIKQSVIALISHLISRSSVAVVRLNAQILCLVELLGAQRVDRAQFLARLVASTPRFYAAAKDANTAIRLLAKWAAGDATIMCVFVAEYAKIGRNLHSIHTCKTTTNLIELFDSRFHLHQTLDVLCSRGDTTPNVFDIVGQVCAVPDTESSKRIIRHLLGNQPSLFRILSAPATVFEILAAFKLSVDSCPHLRILNQLATLGMQSILKSFVSDQGSPDCLTNTDSISLTSMRILIILYHSKSCTGMLEVLEAGERQHQGSLLGWVSVFTRVVGILEDCGRIFCGAGYSGGDDCYVGEPVLAVLVALATNALMLADLIKNVAYDLNLLGVLVSAKDRYVAVGRKFGPMAGLTEACVLVSVGVEKQLQRVRNDGAGCGEEHIGSCIEMNLLQSLSINCLYDFLSVVSYDLSCGAGLEPFLKSAMIVDLRPCGNNFAVLPRFFQSISQTLLSIFGKMQDHLEDYVQYLELFEKLVPKLGSGVDGCDDRDTRVLKAVWEKQLDFVYDEILNVFTLFGHSSSESLYKTLQSNLESILQLCSYGKFKTRFCTDLIKYVENWLGKDLSEFVDIGGCGGSVKARLIILAKTCIYECPVGFPIGAIIFQNIQKIFVEDIANVDGICCFAEFLVAVKSRGCTKDNNLYQDCVHSAINLLLCKSTRNASLKARNMIAVLLNFASPHLIRDFRMWLETCFGGLCVDASNGENQRYDLEFLVFSSLVAFKAGLESKPWFQCVKEKLMPILTSVQITRGNDIDPDLIRLLPRVFDCPNDQSEILARILSLGRLTAEIPSTIFQPVKISREWISNLESSLNRYNTQEYINNEIDPRNVTDQGAQKVTHSTVVFKQYSEDSFRTGNPVLISNVGCIQPNPNSLRTVSNSSRAPSIHVDNFGSRQDLPITNDHCVQRRDSTLTTQLPHMLLKNGSQQTISSSHRFAHQQQHLAPRFCQPAMQAPYFWSFPFGAPDTGYFYQ